MSFFGVLLSVSRVRVGYVSLGSNRVCLPFSSCLVDFLTIHDLKYVALNTDI